MYREPVPDEIKTQALETGGLDKTPVTCEIIESKVIDPGIFKSKFSSYFVKTLPNNWVAERKFENFVNLRNILLKLYPGYIVPPLSAKVEKKLEKADIEKKKNYLQIFLNDLVRHPILRTANILFCFLSMPSEKEYELKAKTYLKMKPPKYANEFCTFEGVAKVSYDVPLSKYCSALAKANVRLKDLHKE